jgi:medium-chain acyl-[acyl-carrier-protein] hydrolase
MGGQGFDTFLEMSPHPSLLPAIAGCMNHPNLLMIPSLVKGEGGIGPILAGLGALYVAGYPVDWTRLHPSGGRVVPLPAYPWQRRRCWIDDPAPPAEGRAPAPPARDGIATDWFLVPRPVPVPRLRVICFPYAGANPASFHGWAARLGSDVEMQVVQLPGRGARCGERPITRMETLIDALVKASRAHRAVPYVLYGHSMGALVAFELVRRLRRDSKVLPTQLLVSGCRGPALPIMSLPPHDLPEKAFIARVGELGGIPAAVLQERELMALLLPSLRADFELLETWNYTPEPPLDMPITAFGGVDDRAIRSVELEAWRPQTRGPFELRLFPGDHFSVLSPGSGLVDAIATRLAGG